MQTTFFVIYTHKMFVKLTTTGDRSSRLLEAEQVVEDVQGLQALQPGRIPRSGPGSANRHLPGVNVIKLFTTVFHEYSY
jgi:hypothetical protein